MQNGTPAPCAPATIPGLSSSDGFSSQTHWYVIGAAPGCESFQSSTRPKRSARSLIALACPLGPRLLPKRRRKIGIRSSSSERTHCGGCMAVRGEVCANSVAPHRGMALAWAMTGLHGDSEVQAPWRGGDIRNSSLSEVPRQEIPAFLRQRLSRDFGKALLNETAHRSMGIVPMVVLGRCN